VVGDGRVRWGVAGHGVLSCVGLGLTAFLSSSREAALISEEELMDIRALARQGLTCAEIGRLLGRDWRTVKRYLERGA
jgi:DNA-binding NarL/FixJ family response regulator